MKFTLIRHSKTLVEPEKPMPLWGLSEDGISVAKEFAANPLIQTIDVMYSSCQTKAIETMVYLAKPNTIPMRTHSDLTEITSFTNKFHTGETYTSQIKNFYSGHIDRIDDGETATEALERFEAALEGIKKTEQAAQNIGIVCHGYILSFFTGKYSDMNPYGLHTGIKKPDIAIFNWEAKQFEKLWG
jgi:broad specificity phosphatase PhoE